MRTSESLFCLLRHDLIDGFVRWILDTEVQQDPKNTDLDMHMSKHISTLMFTHMPKLASKRMSVGTSGTCLNSRLKAYQ